MNVLVTGGAGYIGSVAARHLDRSGEDVWIYDNVSTGHRAAALPGRLIEGELADTSRLEDVLRTHRIEAVMHFAASALVGESVEHPARYYRNNVAGSLSLLDAMRAADVRKIVFSSTTATYGRSRESLIDERHPQQPCNPYGATKLAVERALADYSAAYGLAYAALRYFNAAGAPADGALGEDHRPESHLIPIVLEVALGQREAVTIFGDDYPTPDGTCVRDYIHVDDLATAHVAALDKLQTCRSLKLNLGSGVATSVRQIIDVCCQVTGCEIPTRIGPRRPGDPPHLVADARRAEQFLGWRPVQSDIESIVRSAWRWHRNHPAGYGDDHAVPAPLWAVSYEL
jgi:UDP-glucose-4-epimerase GalE